MGAGRQIDPELSLASRAAWMSYIGGIRQADIARALGVSRPKVNRLIALAHRQKLVRIFIDGDIVDCVTLGDRLVERYGLDFAEVAPTINGSDPPMETIGTLGARAMLRLFDDPALTVLGIGHGRTLAAVVDHLPTVARRDVQVVSLLGGLTRNAEASPFDVIHRLAGKVDGECYFMPVPFFANSAEDRRVLMAQRGVSEVFARAAVAQVCLIGVGEVDDDAYLLESGMITRDELDAVVEAGAEGEILGQFVDARGRVVDTAVNGLALAPRLDDLAGKSVVAVAGGTAKVKAIRAVLNSGAITGLITDEATARALADDGGRAAPTCNNKGTTP